MSEQLMEAPALVPELDAPGEPGDEIVDQIKRLCEFRDAGLITAHQFLLRRAQILGRPY